MERAQNFIRIKPFDLIDSLAAEQKNKEEISFTRSRSIRAVAPDGAFLALYNAKTTEQPAWTVGKCPSGKK